MSYRPELVRSVRAGKRTMFRQPAKGECRYKEKRVYVLRAATDQTPALQITVLEIREERLGSISLRDVKREGHRTTQDFVADWKGVHNGYDENMRVHVVSFVQGDATDTPHMLSANPGSDRADYTTIPARAIRGEGEAVSGKLLERWGTEGRERHADVLADQRHGLLAAVQKVRIEAARRGTGLGAQKRLKSVEHHLKAIENESRGVA